MGEMVYTVLGPGAGAFSMFPRLTGVQTCEVRITILCVINKESRN